MQKLTLDTVWPWMDQVKVKVQSEGYISVEVFKV